MIFGKEVSGPELGIPIRVWSEILSADAARRAELIAHFISKNAKKFCLRRCFGIDPGSGTLKSRYGGVGAGVAPGMRLLLTAVAADCRCALLIPKGRAALRYLANWF